MTYDGSLHFTVKMPMIEKGTPYFGIFIKYIDQFTNYSIKLDFKNRKIFIDRNNPFAYKRVLIQDIEYLSMAQYLRIVVKFDKKKIKIWIHPEEGVSPTQVDLDARQAELE